MEETLKHDYSRSLSAQLHWGKVSTIYEIYTLKKERLYKIECFKIFNLQSKTLLQLKLSNKRIRTTCSGYLLWTSQLFKSRSLTPSITMQAWGLFQQFATGFACTNITLYHTLINRQLPFLNLGKFEIEGVGKWRTRCPHILWHSNCS